MVKTFVRLHLRKRKIVKPHYRRVKSRIYLGKKTAPSYYVDLDKPNKIFLGEFFGDEKDMDMVSKSIAHEELHNTLNKEIGKKASLGLHAIDIPPLYEKENDRFKVINPKTSHELVTNQRMKFEKVYDELGKERYNKHYGELLGWEAADRFLTDHPRAKKITRTKLEPYMNMIEEKLK